ncbi:hypothetical protein ACJX0J_034347, partial [Zea mays]
MKYVNKYNYDIWHNNIASWHRPSQFYPTCMQARTWISITHKGNHITHKYDSNFESEILWIKGGHIFITHISLPEASDYLKEFDAGGWLKDATMHDEICTFDRYKPQYLNTKIRFFVDVKRIDKISITLDEKDLQLLNKREMLGQLSDTPNAEIQLHLIRDTLAYCQTKKKNTDKEKEYTVASDHFITELYKCFLTKTGSNSTKDRTMT